MAVCGYNQPKVNILKLKQAFYEGLEKTPRLNLCGVVLEILGVLYRKTEGGFSWQPTITVEYIENPKYFGTVNIVFKMDEADPHLIRESLTQINTSDLMDGKLSLNPSTTLRFSESTIKAPSRETLLDIIDEIDKDRTILETKSNTLRTFFRGEGNINYVCGKCSRLLAENIWELSLSNIILKCPNCGLYNNISLVKNPPDPKLKKLACVQGENIVDAPIEIKRGIQFIGVKMDEKELQRSRIATLRSR
jgi:DNA-directed RNA polymerase subunit RPC12/RpoP